MASAPRPTNREYIAVGKCDHLYEFRVSILLRALDLKGESGCRSILLEWQVS